MCFRIAFNKIDEDTDAFNDSGCLCGGEMRPPHPDAQRTDDGAPPHSITSSARARSVGGIAMPIALAALEI